MKFRISLGLAAFSLLALYNDVEAQVVSINFAGANAGGAPTSLGSSEVAGVVPAANWNSFVGNSFTAAALKDASGAASPITLTFTTDESWGTGTYAPAAGGAQGNAKLLNGYINPTDTGGDPHTNSITLNDVPAGTYTIITYHVAPGGGDCDTKLLGMYVNDNAAQQHYVIPQCADQWRTANGAWTRVNNTTDANGALGNYVQFENVSPVGGKIKISDQAYSPGNRGAWNGVQIFPTGTAAPSLPPVAITRQPVAALRVLTNTAPTLVVEISQPGATYQWFRVGSPATLIAGATGSSFTPPVVTDADSGVQYYVVATKDGISATSSNSTLTAGHNLFAPGWAKQEVFFGKDRAFVNDPANASATPDRVIYARVFDFGSIGDNYASRNSAIVKFPTATIVHFVVAADDDTDLYLSTDESPATKVLIAQEPTWANRREWENAGPEASSAELFPNGMAMAAGKGYYLEAAHHEGGGGDHVGVTYYPIAGDAPTNGQASALTSEFIGTYVLDGFTVTITNQPAAVTTRAGTTATFKVGVNAGIAVVYQWQKEGVDIQGATAASYTTPLLTTSDNGKNFRVVVFYPTGQTNSSNALLTVTDDTAAPVVTSAGTISGDHVGVKFDEFVDPVTAADATKYTIAGATVSSAILRYDGKSVSLAVTGLPAGAFNLVVTGVKDIAGNTMVAQTVAGYRATHTVNQVMGTPAEEGFAVSVAPGEYQITAGGNDFWGSADNGHFVGDLITGDFDKRVRVESLEPINRWAKSGLQVRESLDADSKQLDIYTMPVGPTLDGGAPGQDGFEAGYRADAGAGTTAWPGGPQQVNPTTYPNAWVRLKRAGEVFTSYWGTDGVNWNPFTTATPSIPFPAQTYVGLMLTSHNDGPGLSADANFFSYGDVPTVVADTVLTITGSGASRTVAWTPTGGILQSTTELLPTGTVWTDVGTANPATITLGGANVFYRVKK